MKIKLLHRLAKRLAEPSTYAGLAGLALALGFNAAEWAAWSQAAAAVFGIVAVILHDPGSGPDDTDG